MMPNAFRVVVSNPNEEQKEKLDEMFGWVEMVYTDEPEYDPDTDEPDPEPTLEDRVDNLEQNISDIVNGATE